MLAVAGEPHSTAPSGPALTTGDPSAGPGLSSLFGAAAASDVVLSEGWIARTAGVASPERDLGRYRLVRMLGAGGFGVVYEATDPALRRRVAIKFIRARRTADAALQREAQAVASVVHPNVVPVYDVGRQGDDLYIVMQYVDGESLDVWLSRGRSQREILEVFAAAGRGLAAVHAAGLSHCDFKPSNVLVGRDGSVQVVDFGLARVVSRSATPTEPGNVDDDDARPFGTPRYMSPEQHAGRPVDVRTDVYSFALALLEALRGAGPVVGGTVSQMFRAKLRPELAAAAEIPGVPAAVVAALARALAPSPDDRPATMLPLLDVLRARPVRRSRRLVAALGVVALAAGATWTFAAFRRDRARDACADQARQDSARVWSPEIEQSLRDAWRGSDVAYAADTVDRVAQIVGGRIETTRAVAEEVCIAATVDDALSDDDHARAQWCLIQQYAQVDALVAAVRVEHEPTLRGARVAAAALPVAATCRDATALRLLPVPPEAARDRIIEVTTALAAMSAHHSSHDPEVLVAAERLLQDARELGWPPLVAAALAQVGDAYESRGNYDEAEAALRAAYFEALGVDALDVAWQAADALTMLVGYKLARPDEGREWWRFAQSALTQLPDDVGTRAIASALHLAAVERSAGRLEVARDSLREVVATIESGGNDLAPAYGAALIALAVAEYETGDPAAALQLAARALPVVEAEAGPDHPAVATALLNLAAFHQAHGDLDTAASLDARALTIRERALGPDHPEVALILHNLGILHGELGDRPRAEALLRRAIEIQSKTLGATHPAVATSALALAATHLDGGDHAEAEARYTQALEIWRAALGDDHPDTKTAIAGLCNVSVAAGDTAQAITRCERAVAVHGDAETSPLELARVQFLLARALASSDGARARTLAEQAFDACGRRDDPPMPCPAGVGKWLAEHAAG